jgi:hypothetical protein
MAKFEDLTQKIIDELQDAVYAAFFHRLSDSDLVKARRHIRSLCGQILNNGRAGGWDEHVVLVRERLTEAGLTTEEFANLPVPDLEGF